MISFLSGVVVLLFADLAWHRRTAWPRWKLAACGGAAAALLALAVWALPGRAIMEKVLGQLVMPTGILWAGMLAAALFAWHRRRLGQALAWLGFWLAFTVAGNEVVGGAMLEALEREYTSTRPRAETAPVAPYDAVLVLGGGTRRLRSEEVTLSAKGDRVVLAARLHHRGLAPILVASGSSIPGALYPRDLAAETLAIWTELGIDEGAVVTVPGPTNTREELEAYAALVRERGWERVGLITSAWHLRRAMRQAEAHDLHVVPIAADIRGGPRSTGLYSLIPSGRGFKAVQLAAWERVGAAVGR
jgi:uncharacterized SAM-binding protein YcdF (DUF218 family)